MVAVAQDFSRHLDEGELENYLMADLREEDAAGFQKHLLDCGNCQRRLAETDAYVASMRRAATQWRNRQRPVADEAGLKSAPPEIKIK